MNSVLIDPIINLIRYHFHPYPYESTRPVGISVVDSIIRRCVVRPGSFESTNQGICVNTQALDESTNDINLIGASSDVGDITKFTGQVRV